TELKQRGRLPHHPLGVEINQKPGGRRSWRCFCNFLGLPKETQAHTQEALQAQLEAQAQAPAQDHGGPSIMERFKRMTPPSFKGESDPLIAESWMRETEKIFRAIRCPDEDKVTLATYMLQERADVWWSSLLRTRFEDGAVVVAWDAFVRLFRAKSGSNLPG
ncbi:hypothetical protein Taro_047861, partial [Colocasia esculenta]|nr:hypothetical protein [Colocasia esculenta]